MKRDTERDNHLPALRDGGEQIQLMEPMRISEQNAGWADLNELAFALAARSNALAGRLAPPIVAAIGDLVRSMNCYYSNLIEGHDTHPIDIEKALKHDYSSDPKQRNLQLEAVAHIGVQGWIDTSNDARGLGLISLVKKIHRDFYTALPEGLHWVDGDNLRERVIPGEWRCGYVQVGQHVAISPGAIPRFMTRWEQAYPRRMAGLLVSLGAMHHRLAWIHPFVDGNGRAGRLVTHALLKEIGVGNPLWAVSRGLARQADRYKALMMAADEPRRGDMDGRGSRSEAALLEFSTFFLEQCLDQIDFMERLIEPDRLTARVLIHVRELIEVKELDPRSEIVMRAILQSGEIQRSELPGIIGEERRTANRVVKALVERGMLGAETHRAPLSINFSAVNAERWLPGLFPPARAMQ